MPDFVKSTYDVAGNNAYFFVSVQGCNPGLGKDGVKISSAVIWSKAKLSAGNQLIFEQVVLKLFPDHSFH